MEQLFPEESMADVFYLPNTHSDFIWPFLQPYMGVIPNPKMAHSKLVLL